MNYYSPICKYLGGCVIVVVSDYFAIHSGISSQFPWKGCILALSLFSLSRPIPSVITLLNKLSTFLSLSNYVIAAANSHCFSSVSSHVVKALDLTSEDLQYNHVLANPWLRYTECFLSLVAVAKVQQKKVVFTWQMQCLAWSLWAWQWPFNHIISLKGLSNMSACAKTSQYRAALLAFFSTSLWQALWFYKIIQ